MTLRHLAAWFSGLSLLAIGATLLCAQPPQPAREQPVRIDRNKLRAEIIKLRTEVEMLRFDYDLAHDALRDELKTAMDIKMAGGLIESFSAIQAQINQAGSEPPHSAPQRKPDEDPKKAAEAAKAVEQQQEKKEAAEEAALIAHAKKGLAAQFALLAEKQLDLEDAERKYREISSRAGRFPGLASSARLHRLFDRKRSNPKCTKSPS